MSESPLAIRAVLAAALAALAALSFLAPRPAPARSEAAGARPAGPTSGEEAVEAPPGSGSARSARRAARAAFRPEELLPPDAIALVSIPDARGFLDALARTGVAQALADPELEPFLKLLSERLPSDLLALKDIALAFLGGLRPALAGGAAIALLRVDVPARAIDAALLAEIAGCESAARAFAATLEMLARAAGYEREALAIGGREVTILRAGRSPGAARDVGAWTIDRDLLVLATSRVAIEEVLLRRAEPAGSALAPTLAELETFASASARAAGEVGKGAGRGDSALEGPRPDYGAFLDVRRAFEDLLGPAAANWRSRLGLEGLDAIAVRGHLGSSVRETAYLLASARGGVLALLGGSETDLGAASFLPGRTLAAVFGRSDGGLIARQLAWAMQRGVVPFGEETARRLSGAAAASGFTPEKLSTLVRGESALALWSAGRVGWFPKIGIAAEVPSPEALEPALDRAWREIATALGGRFCQVELGGPPSAARMRFVDAASLRYPFLESPAWALARPAAGGSGGTARTFLLASGDAMAVRELARPGPAERLDSNRRWRALLDRLPARRSGLVYVDVGAIVERGLEPYAPIVIAGLVPGASRWLTPGSVPAGEILARHLEAAGASSSGDALGFRIDAVTPAGLALTLGACALVVEGLSASP